MNLETQLESALQFYPRQTQLPTLEFVRLPDDLILYLFLHLDNFSIFNLATVCRSLNQLAVTHLLQSYHRISDTSKHCNLVFGPTSNVDALSCLNIDFSSPPRTLHTLTCKLLGDPAHFDHSGALTWLSERLCNFMERSVLSVNTVILDFQLHPTMCDGDPEQLVRPLSEFQKLLNTIASKSCVSLRIMNECLFFGIHWTLGKGNGKKKTSFFKGVKRRLSKDAGGGGPAKHSSRETQGYWQILKPDLTASPHSVLTHLSFDTPSIFSPPLLSWTLSVLKSSPITSLTISLWSSSWKDEGARIPLRMISDTLPDLSELHLPLTSRVTWMFVTDDVIEMVKGFRALKVLSFPGNHPLLTPQRLRNPGSPVPTGIRGLRSLSGSPTELAYFFSPMPLCPDLRHLHLFYDRRFLQPSFSINDDPYTLSISKWISKIFSSFKWRSKPSLECVEVTLGLKSTVAGMKVFYEDSLDVLGNISVGRLVIYVPGSLEEFSEGQHTPFVLFFLSFFSKIVKLELHTMDKGCTPLISPNRSVISTILRLRPTLESLTVDGNECI